MKKLWAKIKAFGRKIGSVFTKKRILNSTYSAVSIAFASYVMWYLLPTWLAVLIVGTVFLHEMGHWIYGKIRGLPVSLPRMFPAIYTVMGWTRVGRVGERGMTAEEHADPGYYLAGPAMGIAACAVIMVGCYIAGFMPGVYAAAWQLTGNLYSAVLGSDGRNYQKARKAADARVHFGMEDPVSAVAV